MCKKSGDHHPEVEENICTKLKGNASQHEGQFLNQIQCHSNQPSFGYVNEQFKLDPDVGAA